MITPQHHLQYKYQSYHNITAMPGKAITDLWFHGPWPDTRGYCYWLQS